MSNEGTRPPAGASKRKFNEEETRYIQANMEVLKKVWNLLFKKEPFSLEQKNVGRLDQIFAYFMDNEAGFPKEERARIIYSLAVGFGELVKKHFLVDWCMVTDPAVSPKPQFAMESDPPGTGAIMFPVAMVVKRAGTPERNFFQAIFSEMGKQFKPRDPQAAATGGEGAPIESGKPEGAKPAGNYSKRRLNSNEIKYLQTNIEQLKGLWKQQFPKEKPLFLDSTALEKLDWLYAAAADNMDKLGKQVVTKMMHMIAFGFGEIIRRHYMVDWYVVVDPQFGPEEDLAIIGSDGKGGEFVIYPISFVFKRLGTPERKFFTLSFTDLTMGMKPRQA